MAVTGFIGPIKAVQDEIGTFVSCVLLDMKTVIYRFSILRRTEEVKLPISSCIAVISLLDPDSFTIKYIEILSVDSYYFVNSINHRP